MYTVGLYTLGCKVSQYETEAVRESFIGAGYEARPFDEKNDVYIINTCTVTDEADRKSRQFIRRAIRKNPDATVIVMGCYAQRSPEKIAAIGGVSAVIGTNGKMRALEIVEGLRAGIYQAPYIAESSLDAPFEPMRVSTTPRTRAYVKIEDGCDSKCSYCAIRLARGGVRSKRPEEVIDEVCALFKSGVPEVVLTGIETAAYGKDFKDGYTLPDLLHALDLRIGEGKIRLGSLAPELVGEDFANRVSTLKSLVPHFHISVQSGSDRVLRLMKRRYTAEKALENIKRLKSLIPSAQFTADIMVGFPGESIEDFEQSAKFIENAQLLDCHVFTFSAREGTEAYAMENQVPESEKHARTRELIRIKNAQRERTLEKIIESKKPLPCIFESYDGEYYTAHSDSFAAVKVKSECDIRGTVSYVMPTAQKDGTIYGKIITM
ncbi:MAG: tRNA (N(6)-L-threonylcarbamoyladenosine(37)-C(2))-methylthiotransferase MtaB [Clostridia bacterium]|nr:tRNA (N(6)-L-threonylcarbamoyladenosine(37)-C(2))-methylthiotransferase MtaB [Clostridia bacterium]